MKAWRLNTRATLHELQGEPPAPVVLGLLWCSGAIVPAGTADIAAAPGLRSAVPVTIRARWSDTLRAGRYLSSAAGDLWHIDSVRDPDGRRTDLLLTCTALAGDPATVTPAAGDPYSVRAVLLRSAVGLGEFGAAVEHRFAVELAVCEAAGVATGDTLALAGRDWLVVDPVPGSWDGVTHQVYVR